MSIKIHVYWLVFLSYAFAVGKLKSYCLFYLSAFTHEVAHIVVALIFHVEIKELWLIPFGVNAKLEKESTPWREVLICLAGPLLNLFLCLFAQDSWVKKINGGLFFFNILPLYPLDGGRIQRVIAKKIYGEVRGIQKSIKMSACCLGILLVIAFVCAMKWQDYYLFFLIWYLLILFQRERKKDRLTQRINCLQIEEKCIK